jgi:uncharacterized membrane protein YfcA
MTADSIIYISAVALAAFLTGVSKAGLGGTMGVLITPMMALIMPADQAIGLLLPIFILGDIFALIAHWRHWNRSLLWLLIPGGLVGVTLGAYVLTNISTTILQRLLGIFVFLFILYRLVEGRVLKALRYRARNWHGWVAGGLAGFTSTLAHAGGPPIVIYLLMQDIAPRVFVATSVLFFAMINWIKVPYYYQAGLFDFAGQMKLLWLAPLVPLGVWVGSRLAQRIDRGIFEWIILVLLGISGVLLLTR